MLDSIFTGITGVRAHQAKINVIGNNVANINTTAFKAGRVNFADVMSRTLSEGGPGQGQVAATNPIQSGLGVKVSSIDSIVTQGTLQSTGVETDLAIEGDGMFIMGTGPDRFYTRDGTFGFDATGRLYDPGTGLVVQGNVANEDGTFKSELEDLIIPLDRESEAKATSKVNLSGNLDASAEGSGSKVWNANTVFGKPARLTTTTNPSFPLDLSIHTSGGLKITVNDSGRISESTINIPTKVYADQLELVAEMNALINANGSLKNKVLFQANNLGQLVLRTVTGGSNVTVQVDNATTDNVAGSLGFTTNTAATGDDVSVGDQLNDLANVAKDLSPPVTSGNNVISGDVIRFSGIKPNGERFDGTFNYTDGPPPSTLADLFTAVGNVYGGVDVGLDPGGSGQIIITEKASQTRVTGFDVSFSLLDNGLTDATTSGIFGDDPPFEFSTNTQVFDETGESHSLTVTFTRSVVNNEWSWVASVDGLTPASGNNGRAVFNNDGTLRTFVSSDGQPLGFSPSNGAPPLAIEIVADRTDRLGGITQFVAPSSASVREQDGRSVGSLLSVNIQSNGNITGLFSNGTAEELGRVILATFGNPAGLRREGENLFTETESSGQAVTGAAESTVQGSVHSGAIELSNVDLAEQFTNMILAQRGFQASARTITTSDELLSELVNLKR